MIRNFESRSRVAVVLQQALAHVAGGHADDRVVGRVIRHRAAEQGDSDTALPQIRRLAVQRLFDNVLEKCLAAVAAFESGPIDDLCR